MTARNLQWRLIKEPSGAIDPSDLQLVDAPLPEPGEGEVLIRNLYLSIDPAQRVFMTASYLLADDVVRAWSVGEVVASRSPAFREGDLVRDLPGRAGMQAYVCLPAEHLWPIDPGAASLPAYLGVLGMPGLTAYFGMLDAGQPRDGETVVVSAAAGTVGMVAGQIAAIKGARVIGIAGGKVKCEYLQSELGFAAAVDYKDEDWREALREACAGGIDVYFDNVGGETLDACLAQLNHDARIVGCGALTAYNGTAAPISNYDQLLRKSAVWRGFSYYRYVNRTAEGERQLAEWIAQGQLRHQEQAYEGISAFLTALGAVYAGKHIGKVVLDIRAS